MAEPHAVESPVPAPRRLLGAGAALSVLVQGGPLVAGGALSIVLARTLGPSGNGRFSLLVTLCGITTIFISLGLTAGITYEVSRRRWAIRDVFRTSYAAAAVLGCAGFLGALGVFALLRDTVFGGISVAVAVIALASLPPVLAFQFADAVMLARERYERYAVLELAHSAVFLAVGAGLALPFGLTGAAIGLPASAGAAAALGALLLAREREPGVSDPRPLGRALRFGIQSWAANLLQQVNYRFDILILGGFAAATAVGVYSVALTVTSVAWILPQALQTVLFPRTASLDEAALSGEITGAESDAALAKATRHGVLLMVPATLLAIVLLTIVVPLAYGSAFHETIGLGFVLLPGVVLLGAAKVLSSGIAGRGRPRYTLYIAVLSMPVTLALYVVLIHAYDEYGAAVASSISYALSAALSLVFFRRATRLDLRAALVPRRDDLSDYGSLIRHLRA